MGPLTGELIAGIVPSPLARGRVKRLDVSAARQIAGVAAILTHHDLGRRNLFGPVVKDELLLVEDESAFLGQP
ncbi:MAG: hypothetical protein H7144_16250, partial [Burkholderiales bacterium]|nr:hypothetical protein [Phycisphaerae bacterium]